VTAAFEDTSTEAEEKAHALVRNLIYRLDENDLNWVASGADGAMVESIHLFLEVAEARSDTEWGETFLEAYWVQYVAPC
jgi:hypothetical protein